MRTLNGTRVGIETNAAFTGAIASLVGAPGNWELCLQGYGPLNKGTGDTLFQRRVQICVYTFVAHWPSNHVVAPNLVSDTLCVKLSISSAHTHQFPQSRIIQCSVSNCSESGVICLFCFVGKSLLTTLLSATGGVC